MAEAKDRTLIFDGLPEGGFHYSEIVDPKHRGIREVKFTHGQVVAESAVPDAARVIARRIARVLDADELAEIRKAEAAAAKAAAEHEARLAAADKQ